MIDMVRYSFNDGDDVKKWYGDEKSSPHVVTKSDGTYLWLTPKDGDDQQLIYKTMTPAGRVDQISVCGARTTYRVNRETFKIEDLDNEEEQYTAEAKTLFPNGDELLERFRYGMKHDSTTMTSSGKEVLSEEWSDGVLLESRKTWGGDDDALSIDESFDKEGLRHSTKTKTQCVKITLPLESQKVELQETWRHGFFIERQGNALPASAIV
jgi:hypothetical protein